MYFVSILRKLQQQQFRPRPSSGFYGVHADGKKWRAQITYGGKQNHLGTFDTKEQAALAYDQAVRKHAPDKPLNYESIEAAEAAADRAKAEATFPRGLLRN